MKSFLIFFSIVTAIAVIDGHCYCNWDCTDYLTNSTIKNIGCNHTQSFDKNNCPTNAKIVTITRSLRNALAKAHNEKRNFIAGGGDTNHESACRMATMKWDRKLAYLAELNVRQCKMKRDKCHRTNVFKYSGQNLAIVTKTPAGKFDDAEQLRNAVENWYSEVKYSNQSIIDSYPENYKGPAIEHFAVMMADRNIRFGCSAATYSGANETTFLTACNYATTNMSKKRIYKKCKKAGRHCKTGNNPKYYNLCNTNEKYVVNKFFSYI